MFSKDVTNNIILVLFMNPGRPDFTDYCLLQFVFKLHEQRVEINLDVDFKKIKSFSRQLRYEIVYNTIVIYEVVK